MTVRWTVVPIGIIAVQVPAEVAQLNWESVATVPVADCVPVVMIVNATRFRANVAVTVRSASSVTAQSATPAQSPDQPANVDVASGCAESVSTVPTSKQA